MMRPLGVDRDISSGELSDVCRGGEVDVKIV